MIEKEILRKIKQIVFELLKNEGTGHDFFHIQRVVNNTKKIISSEKCNETYALLLAYLHDLGDYKLHEGKDKTKEIITPLLNEFGYDDEFIKNVVNDINLIGFKGGLNQKPTKIEVQIVQDADRLDAMGAIGIARAFAYGGNKGRLLHDPLYSATSYSTIEEYKNSKAPTIQHFYDKLLKLKYLMNTQTGKKLAEERHAFMETYLQQFYAEWEGDLI